MSHRASDLIMVTALCQVLLEAIERLDAGIAGEAPIAELRAFRDLAEAELERCAHTQDRERRKITENF